MSAGRRAVAGCVLAAVVIWFAGTVSAEVVKTRMLADFENDTGQFAPGVTIVTSQNLTGKGVLLSEGKPGLRCEKVLDWPAYNFFKFDVFNPAEAPARLQVVFKDDSAPHGYYSWINRYVSVPAGKSTVELDLTQLRRGEGSPKDMTDPRPFHWDKVQQLLIGRLSGDVELDNVRLELVKVGIPEGLRAFDFGPEDSPCFLGFQAVTPQTAYSDRTGFGWTRTGEMYARYRKNPPDSLVGDWISGNGPTFTVAVPNGKYVVWLIWEDSGEWEYYQNYPWRRIECQAKTVFEEKMTGKDFLDRYFHFAEVEDSPGEDIWQKYVGWRYQPRTFQVDVTNGRLDLAIYGPNQYAATLNALVIYPEAKAADAKKFLDDVTARRREEFGKHWVEQLPKPDVKNAADLKPFAAEGYVLFQRPWSRDVGYYDLPRPEELQVNLEASAARGEYEPMTFSVHALKPLNDVRVRMGAFVGPNGATLPAEAFQVRYVSYKFKVIGFGGAGLYGVVPFVLKPLTTTTVAADQTRRFWVDVHVPANQPGGTYTGSLTLSATGVPDRSLPVKVTVWPFALPDADMGLSMYSVGSTAPWTSYGFAENEARVKADQERSLECARSVGFTYVRVEGIAFKGFQGGKARFDFSEAKVNVERARRLGFGFIDLDGGQGIFAQAIRDDGTLARKEGFASADDLVREVFGSAIAGAKAAGLPEPVWSFGDEPPETVAPEFVTMYSRMRDLAGAKSYIAYSPHGAETSRLLDVTSVSSLNGTDLEQINRALKNGNVVQLNNQGANRWAYGLYMWKAHQAGVHAYEQFTFLGTHADPYYPLDSYEDDGGRIFPNRQGDLYVRPDLKRIREGVDDYRYCLALTQAILRNHNPQGAQAAEWLKGVLEKIRFENTGQDRRPQMTDVQLDEFRRTVAQWVTKLSAQ